ncbi:MAG TPA: hypothetical protein VME46_22860 [Acidimicrobiales bacterium]|nr:hypothetical protein [Acidimicrobiales bacterium]
MGAVSCVATTSTCAAIGQDPNLTIGFVFDWDGSWRPQPAQFPPSPDDVPRISCARSPSGLPECAVVGSERGAGREHPFVLTGAVGS